MLTNWKTFGSGDWFDASRWDSGHVPGKHDIAHFGGEPFASYAVAAAAPFTIGGLSVTDPFTTLLLSGGVDRIKGGVFDAGFLKLDTADGQGGGKLVVQGTFDSTGTLAVGNPHLSANSTVSLSSLGTIRFVTLTGSSDFRATLNAQAVSAPATLIGFLTLSGNALLEFGSGQISTIDGFGGITLTGTHAVIADKGHTSGNSALTALSANGGLLELDSGAAVATNAGTNFANAGNLELFGGSLLLGGALTNSGFGHIVVAGGTGHSTGSLQAASFVNSSNILVSEASMFRSHGGTLNAGTHASIDVDTGSTFTDDVSFLQQKGGTRTTVEGTLAAPSITIRDGLFAGHGTLVGSVNLVGGTFEALTFGINPAVGPGTMSVHGDLAAGRKSTIDAVVDFFAHTASGIAVTNGTVALSGGTLKLDFLNPGSVQDGETFTLMTFAPGALSGQFGSTAAGALTGSGTSLDLGNGHTLDVAYDNVAGEITLTAVATPAAPGEDGSRLAQVVTVDDPAIPAPDFRTAMHGTMDWL